MRGDGENGYEPCEMGKRKECSGGIESDYCKARAGATMRWSRS